MKYLIIHGVWLSREAAILGFNGQMEKGGNKERNDSPLLCSFSENNNINHPATGLSRLFNTGQFVAQVLSINMSARFKVIGMQSSFTLMKEMCFTNRT